MVGTEFILTMIGLGLLFLVGIIFTIVLIRADMKCKYLQKELNHEIAINSTLNDQNNELAAELEKLKNNK